MRNTQPAGRLQPLSALMLTALMVLAGLVAIPFVAQNVGAAAPKVGTPGEWYSDLDCNGHVDAVTLRFVDTTTGLIAPMQDASIRPSDWTLNYVQGSQTVATQANGFLTGLPLTYAANCAPLAGNLPTAAGGCPAGAGINDECFTLLFPEGLNPDAGPTSNGAIGTSYIPPSISYTPDSLAPVSSGAGFTLQSLGACPAVTCRVDDSAPLLKAAYGKTGDAFIVAVFSENVGKTCPGACAVPDVTDFCVNGVGIAIDNTVLIQSVPSASVPNRGYRIQLTGALPASLAGLSLAVGAPGGGSCAASTNQIVDSVGNPLPTPGTSVPIGGPTINRVYASAGDSALVVEFNGPVWDGTTDISQMSSTFEIIGGTTGITGIQSTGFHTSGSDRVKLFAVTSPPAAVDFAGNAAHFRLDANRVFGFKATGVSAAPTGTATMGVCPTVATQDYCLTDPAASLASNGPPTVQAISGAIAAPRVLSFTTLDTNSNGCLDAIRVVWNENMLDTSFAAGGWRVMFPGEVNPTVATMVTKQPVNPLPTDADDDQVTYLSFAETCSGTTPSPWGNTGVLPRVSFCDGADVQRIAAACNAAGVAVDKATAANRMQGGAAGVLPGYIFRAPTLDGAKPVIVSASTVDTAPNNGYIDGMLVTMSEGIDSASVAQAQWTAKIPTWTDAARCPMPAGTTYTIGAPLVTAGQANPAGIPVPTTGSLSGSFTVKLTEKVGLNPVGDTGCIPDLTYTGSPTFITDVSPAALKANNVLANPNTSGGVANTAGTTTTLVDTTKNFVSLGVVVGNVLRIASGAAAGDRIITTVAPTTLTWTGAAGGATAVGDAYNVLNLFGGTDATASTTSLADSGGKNFGTTVAGSLNVPVGGIVTVNTNPVQTRVITSITGAGTTLNFAVALNPAPVAGTTTYNVQVPGPLCPTYGAYGGFGSLSSSATTNLLCESDGSPPVMLPALALATVGSDTAYVTFSEPVFGSGASPAQVGPAWTCGVPVSGGSWPNNRLAPSDFDYQDRSNGDVTGIVAVSPIGNDCRKWQLNLNVPSGGTGLTQADQTAGDCLQSRVPTVATQEGIRDAVPAPTMPNPAIPGVTLSGIGNVGYPSDGATIPCVPFQTGPPVVQSAVTIDSDHDGTLDAIKVQFIGALNDPYSLVKSTDADVNAVITVLSGPAAICGIKATGALYAHFGAATCNAAVVLVGDFRYSDNVGYLLGNKRAGTPVLSGDADVNTAFGNLCAAPSGMYVAATGAACPASVTAGDFRFAGPVGTGTGRPVVAGDGDITNAYTATPTVVRRVAGPGAGGAPGQYDVLYGDVDVSQNVNVNDVRLSGFNGRFWNVNFPSGPAIVTGVTTGRPATAAWTPTTGFSNAAGTTTTLTDTTKTFVGAGSLNVPVGATLTITSGPAVGVYTVASVTANTLTFSPIAPFAPGIGGAYSVSAHAATAGTGPTSVPCHDSYDLSPNVANDNYVFICVEEQRDASGNLVPNTGATPTFSYAGSAIVDGAGSIMGVIPTFKTTDGAQPVLVSALVGAGTKTITVLFSETVTEPGGNALQVGDFAYSNANSGSNANCPSGATALASIAGGAAPSGFGPMTLTLTADGPLTVDDIGTTLFAAQHSACTTPDSLRPIPTQIVAKQPFTDPAVGQAFNPATPLKFVDLQAPTITSAGFVDANGDGIVDAVQVKFSEPINDNAIASAPTAGGSQTTLIDTGVSFAAVPIGSALSITVAGVTTTYTVTNVNTGTGTLTFSPAAAAATATTNTYTVTRLNIADWSLRMTTTSTSSVQQMTIRSVTTGQDGTEPTNVGAACQNTYSATTGTGAAMASLRLFPSVNSNEVTPLPNYGKGSVDSYIFLCLDPDSTRVNGGTKDMGTGLPLGTATSLLYTAASTRLGDSISPALPTNQVVDVPTPGITVVDLARPVVLNNCRLGASNGIDPDGAGPLTGTACPTNVVDDSVETADLDNDGKIDAMRIKFSESVKDSTFSLAQWSLTGRAITGMKTDGPSSVADDNLVWLQFAEASSPDGGNGRDGTTLPDVGYFPGGTMTDMSPAANLLRGVATGTCLTPAPATSPATGCADERDGAAPTLVSITASPGTNLVTIQFSEAVSGTGAGGVISSADLAYVNAASSSGASSIQSISHNAGGKTVTLTLNANLKQDDVAAGADKIVFTPGNIMETPCATHPSGYVYPMTQASFISPNGPNPPYNSCYRELTLNAASVALSGVGNKIPPSTPTLTENVATRTATSVDLKWTAATAAPGDSIGNYEIFYCICPAVPASHAGATAPGGLPRFSLPATASTQSVAGLTSGQTYSFVVRAVDNSGNFGADSTSLTVTPSVLDTDKPCDTGTITVGTITATSVAISWKAPDGDCTAKTGQAVASYNVAAGTGSIVNQASFTSSIKTSGLSFLPSIPGATGSNQILTVSGLVTGQTYNFAIQAVDAAGNKAAGIGTPVTATPTAGATPGTPTGLTAVLVAGTYNSVTLTWTASGADGSNGKVLGYEVRASTTTNPTQDPQSIVAAVFGSTNFAGPGLQETAVVNNLNPSTTYYFTVAGTGTSGTAGSASTPAGPITIGPNPSALALTQAQLDTLEATFAATLKVTHSGNSNTLTWDAPPGAPLPSGTATAPALGIQVWKSTDGGKTFTLLTQIAAGTTDFTNHSFTDTPGSASDQYKVTAVYGTTKATGLAGAGGSSDISNFSSLASASGSSTILGLDPTLFWILVGVAALLLILLVVLLVVRSRRSSGADIDDADVDEEGFAAVDDSVAVADEPTAEMAGAPDDLPLAAAAVVAAEPAPPAQPQGTPDKHYLTCPKCTTEFTASGIKPLSIQCPNCGVRGTLR